MAHYGRPGGFTPFQYGYTLGPGNEANNGDYAVYNQYAAAHAAAAGGVGQSPNNITIQGRDHAFSDVVVRFTTLT